MLEFCMKWLVKDDLNCDTDGDGKADVLVIGKLEQISPESCVTHKRTSQYYILELIFVI